MAQTVPTTEPARVTAGDTLAWSITLPDYPANAGWSLKYRLISVAGAIDITTTAAGDAHVVNVAAAVSSGYAAGTYAWQRYVEKGAERYTTGIGTLVIAPNLAAQVGGYDTRTPARKILDAIEAALLGRASRTDLEYEVAGHRLKSMAHADLLAARSKIQAEVAREEASARIAAGESPRRKILTRFM